MKEQAARQTAFVAIGDIAIHSIIDGVGYENAREALLKPSSTLDPWTEHSDLLEPNGMLELTVGGYLIRTKDRLVIVDTGVGTINNERYRGGRFIEELAAVGVQPHEVTDVVLTHLHFDHVGWTTQKGKVVFPNAVYRCHGADWSHFVEGNDADPGAARKLSPIAPHLETFESDINIAPGVSVRHAPGHTPGSTIVVVSEGSQRAMLIGDVAHCPIELTEDDWEAMFDVDRNLAKATRETLARELDGSGTLLGAAHFPHLQFGRLLSGVTARSWRFE